MFIKIFNVYIEVFRRFAKIKYFIHFSHMFSHPPGAKYPDTIALTYDEKNHKLTCVYNDHSLYVWDVRDIKRVCFIFIFIMQVTRGFQYLFYNFFVYF